MTNLLTVVAKVFSNTLIFFFQQKIAMYVYLLYFKIHVEILTSREQTTSLSFEQLGLDVFASVKRVKDCCQVCMEIVFS